MGVPYRSKIRPGFVVILFAALSVCARAQQNGTAEHELAIQSNPLPQALLHQPFHSQLRADGGLAPLTWTTTAGDLPEGMSLSKDGVLAGSPQEVGEFHFIVAVADSSHPPRERDQEMVLRVVAPLSVRWNRYPRAVGQRIEGSVEVTNATGWDFDFTLIVLAVNEIGRATALGYQHAPLKNNTVDFEIPFGENLPPGAYAVHVDAVGEVAAQGLIFRARVQTGSPVQIQTVP